MPSRDRYAFKERSSQITGKVAEFKKVTDPIEAGLFSLRIKSSKAFPPGEISVIEELMQKMKKVREEKGKDGSSNNNIS